MWSVYCWEHVASLGAVTCGSQCQGLLQWLLCNQLGVLLSVQAVHKTSFQHSNDEWGMAAACPRHFLWRGICKRVTSIECHERGESGTYQLVSKQPRNQLKPQQCFERETISSRLHGNVSLKNSGKVLQEWKLENVYLKLQCNSAKYLSANIIRKETKLGLIISEKCHKIQKLKVGVECFPKSS